MTKLIILRGNSGSGKTTTAKNLKQALSPKQSLLISQDVVRREWLFLKMEGMNSCDERVHTFFQSFFFASFLF